MSTKPGATVRPLASMVCLAVAPASGPMATILLPRMPMSPRNEGFPVPSTRRPPRISRSKSWAKAGEANNRNSNRERIGRGSVYYNGNVALDFYRRAAGVPRSLGVLPAAFNPPTLAHLALARAALGVVDEVLFVLPRQFPHKQYEGATFEERLEMLEAATSREPRFSIAASAYGLFAEIADECREA